MKYLFILLTTFCCFSQNSVIVNYKLISEVVTDKSVETNFRLFSNSEKYLYKLISFSENEKNTFTTTEKENYEEVSVFNRIKDNETIYFTYTDLIGRKTKTSDNIDGIKYLIEEDSPNFDWKIVNETKKIDNYNCQKAITTFRGRTYHAWFTEEIPNQGGPWKFNNLPGLILEVFDTDNKYHWYATKVNIENIVFEMPKVNYQIIDLKKSVLLQETFYRKKMEIMDSRLPSGMVSGGSRIIRSGMEIKYEWEE